MAQKKSSKSGKHGLQPQPDPRAKVDSKLLLQHLTRLMKTLEQDLLERADGSKGLTEALIARHEHDVAAERTADAYDPWRRGVVTQVAAAWVLNLVFVRVLEDRGLVDHNRIAGTGAEGSQGEFLKLAPFLTERDYLLTVFRELSHFEVTRELFDPKRNLAFRITPSAEGAKALLQVFRQGSAEAPAFRFGQADTRFLGDLYQDLSESVRKKYALLQTPDFVEAFILDRTLDPALESYGLDDTTLIDPTCGSGHFLLGAFERLFDRHLKERPNQNPREAAQKALGAVFGTDINPYAVSIAKFRLMLAFLDKAGLTKLSSAPEVPLNVAVADSLLHQVAGEHPGQTDFGYRPGQSTRDWFAEAFALEEDEKAKAILGRRFAAVVGNPPYITVKDSALREKYRQQYVSAAGKYALSAPFAERFFQLCRPGAYTGMITANSFMKREFGKKLITEVLRQLDLQLVVNASGAYIPGHGTPTVLLFGQSRSPASEQVRAVLAKRGEPTIPDVPAQGHVWTSIAAQWNNVAFDNAYIAVADFNRATLGKHPWCLAGGGVCELKILLEKRAKCRLRDMVQDIGFASFTGLDEAFIVPLAAARRAGIDEQLLRPIVIGESVRDWSVAAEEVAITPYDRQTHAPLALVPRSAWARFLWPFRACSEGVKSFGGKTRKQCGDDWWTWYRWQRERYVAPLRITFAEVATHNHFALDQGGKVFNQTAPIITLRESATLEEHYALLAYLNSSTACIWMKQVAHNKGYGADAKNARTTSESWEDFYQFAGKALKALPIPAAVSTLAPYGRLLTQLAERRVDLRRAAIELTPDLEQQDEQLFGEMVAAQERLDWAVYALWDLTCAVPELPDRMRPAERWFLSNTNSSAYFRDPQHAASLESMDAKRKWSGTTLAASCTTLRSAAALDSAERHFSSLNYPASIRLDQDRKSIDGAAVPYLSSLRYTGSGLEKYSQWLKTWDLQRREDSGQAVKRIVVPPKYKAKDFRQTKYWSLRGKLDVPKERFIGYPACESDEDQSPVYGWAGWNHLERARALAALYDARKEEGWKPERLLPMLVGLLELMPWLKQYHNEPDEAVGGERPAEEFEAFVAGELRQAGKTVQEAEREVLAWAQAGGAKSDGAKAARRAGAKLEDEVPESGTRSSEFPDANDAAPATRMAPAARLRKTRGRDNAPPHEPDANGGAELDSPSRPRAAAGTPSSRRRPATPPASKRKKA